MCSLHGESSAVRSVLAVPTINIGSSHSGIQCKALEHLQMTTALCKDVKRDVT